MSEDKFTPGPWIAQDRTIFHGYVVASAQYNPDNRSVLEQRANARLMAAAPDLLAALRALEPYLATRQEMLNYASLNEGRASPFDIASVLAREAIAKATLQPSEAQEPKPELK